MDDSHSLREQIHQLIAQNDIDQAFELLANNQFTRLDKELILLNNRYNKAKEERRMGITSKDEADREFNQINLALIDLAGRINSKPLSFPTAAAAPSSKPLYYLLPLLLVLAGTAFYFLKGSGEHSPGPGADAATSTETEAPAGDGLNKDIENKMWNLAVQQNNLESFSAYLDMFPAGEFIQEARNKIREIGEDQLWTRAREHDLAPFYEDYLKQFPSGRFADTATARIAMLQQAEAKRLRDNEDFETAAKANTQEAFRQYLSQHPEGEYRALAEANIRALEANKQCDCPARNFRNRSDHTSVEFRLPKAKIGTTVSIPGGAYNKYVFPKCNRVWWDNLVFSCDPNSCRWERVSGRWDADALCHGSYTPHKYLVVGTH